MLPMSDDVTALVDEMRSCANLLSDGPGVPWAKTLLLNAAATIDTLSRQEARSLYTSRMKYDLMLYFMHTAWEAKSIEKYKHSMYLFFPWAS